MFLSDLQEQHIRSIISSRHRREGRRGPAFLADVAPTLSFPEQRSHGDTVSQRHTGGGRLYREDHDLLKEQRCESGSPSRGAPLCGSAPALGGPRHVIHGQLRQ